MLTRLASREPANRVWFTLVDKTYVAPANLQCAFEKVWRSGGSAGADAQTVARFGRRAGEELQRQHEQLRGGTYRPQPVRRAWTPKPGRKAGPSLQCASRKAQVGAGLACRDRTVQGALRYVLEPIFETDFAGHSYGFPPGRAPGRGGHAAEGGHDWVVDADLKSYFDTIPHDRLMRPLKERVADGRVTALVESILRATCFSRCKQPRCALCKLDAGGRWFLPLTPSVACGEVTRCFP